MCGSVQTTDCRFQPRCKRVTVTTAQTGQRSAISPFRREHASCGSSFTYVVLLGASCVLFASLPMGGPTPTTGQERAVANRLACGDPPWFAQVNTVGQTPEGFGMDTGRFASQERVHGPRMVARATVPDSNRPRHEPLNIDIDNEKARVLAQQAAEDLPQTSACATVLLLGGPYDGQDIRVSAIELGGGSLLRGGHLYLREGLDTALGIGARLPTFRWKSETGSMRASGAGTAAPKSGAFVRSR